MTRTPHTPHPQHSEGVPSREQAAALLAQAESKRREVAQFSPVMMVFAVMCTTAGLGILLIGYTDGPRLVAGMIAWLAYLIVGSFMPFLLRRNREARGFGKRWGILMGVWGALWGLSVAVTSIVSNGTNENLQIVVPVLFSVAFLVLMIFALTAEASRVQRERHSLATPNSEA